MKRCWKCGCVTVIRQASTHSVFYPAVFYPFTAFRHTDMPIFIFYVCLVRAPSSYSPGIVLYPILFTTYIIVLPAVLLLIICRLVILTPIFRVITVPITFQGYGYE